MKAAIRQTARAFNHATPALRRRRFVRKNTSAKVDPIKSKALSSFKLTKILVPTDFSKGSRRALHYALAFARQSGASFTLLHVVRAKCSAIGRVSDLALEEELKHGGARKLSELVQQLLGDVVSAKMAVRIGSPAREIVRAAQDLDTDLIVISTHGRTALKHLLLGSVTEAVVRHSTCPVLVVREREHGFVCSESQLAGKKCSAFHKACAGDCACLTDLDCETKNRSRLMKPKIPKSIEGGTRAVTPLIRRSAAIRRAGLAIRGELAPSLLHIKSILVPIDFSASSKKALAYAVPFAEQFGAKLILLNVVEPVAAPDFAKSFPFVMEDDKLMAASKGQLEHVIKEQAIDPKLVEKALVRYGRSFHEIAEAARMLKVDLIIISTHGYTGLKHALLGSTTERVVRHAPCPVLVVRECESEFV